MIKSCYIHIPFCNTICTYCDFCKLYKNESLILKYLNELKKEIQQKYKHDTLKTLYVGGGTPSCLNKKELDLLFEILSDFSFDNEYEFTFECNINDINKYLLLKLKANRVNRLSIGIESFNLKLLSIMGRNNCNTIDKINLCKKYFSNINVDLIYGLKEETLNDLKKDLEKFLKLDVSHISIYSLILENNTILKINNYEEIDDNLSRDMYDYIRKILKKNNYIQYEISNFSKKGYCSSHNITYWNNEEYYGFGLSASGFINNKRYTNTKGINNYLKSNYVFEEKKQTLKENMENYMILGLRKIEGVSISKFKSKYNKNIEDVFNVNKLKKKGDYYYIPSSNLFVSNNILVDFIDI